MYLHVHVSVRAHEHMHACMHACVCVCVRRHLCVHFRYFCFCLFFLWPLLEHVYNQVLCMN